MADNITGLVVGAPYLACAVLGCWLTAPLNSLFGRRGTIFISCLIAALASIWEGVANSWVNLFVSRFVLGLGIGSKSTTVPVYAAECSPPLIRGALVMMWQVRRPQGSFAYCFPSIRSCPRSSKSSYSPETCCDSNTLLDQVILTLKSPDVDRFRNYAGQHHGCGIP